MKRLFLFLLLPLLTHSQWNLKVAANKQSLTLDGKPFFWMGDTNWELFHRLNREEIDYFIQKRSEQGFNVLQAVALAEMNGLKHPNRHGDLPLIDLDPTKLAITEGNRSDNEEEYDYWDHVDYALETAKKYNVFIGLLPTWGDKVAHLWGDGPIVFDENNARIYGINIAKRLAKHPNIIWIIGGDRAATYKNKDKFYDDRPIWRAMAEGLKEGDKFSGVPERLMTYHPMGGKGSRTSLDIHQETWLDMNAFQSGHGSKDPDCWNWVVEDLQKEPKKPTIDMEPCYEDHPVNPWNNWTREKGYFTPYDVRCRMYRSVVAGAAGVTYGHHQIWQFLNTELYPPINVGDTLIGWQKAIYAQAATQMVHLKKFFEPIIGDTRMLSNDLVLSDKGSTYKDIVLASVEQNHKYAIIHVPFKQKLKLDLSKFNKKSLRIDLFDPKTSKILQSKSVKNNIVEFEPNVEIHDFLLFIK